MEIIIKWPRCQDSELEQEEEHRKLETERGPAGRGGLGALQSVISGTGQFR